MPSRRFTTTFQPYLDDSLQTEKSLLHGLASKTGHANKPYAPISYSHDSYSAIIDTTIFFKNELQILLCTSFQHCSGRANHTGWSRSALWAKRLAMVNLLSARVDECQIISFPTAIFLHAQTLAVLYRLQSVFATCFYNCVQLVYRVFIIALLLLVDRHTASQPTHQSSAL